MKTLLQEIRYALRQLRNAPGFAVTAIVTLALGIGATTAIFTLVHAVLLRSLPVTDPGQLWLVGAENTCCVTGGYIQLDSEKKPDFSLFSYPLYESLRAHTPALESLAAFQAGFTSLSVRRAGSDHAPESARAELVSGNYFSTLGVGAYLGRVLTSADDQANASPVAVVTYRRWQQSLGGDPSIIGGSLLMNGQLVTVVGVTPPSFYGDRLRDPEADYLLPIHTQPLISPQVNPFQLPTPHWLDLIGRVPHGGSVAAAKAQLNVALMQWLRSHQAEMLPAELRELPREKTTLSPGGGGVQQMQTNYRSGLHLLMAVSAFVLLIACGNIANLTLVRGMARRQQLSVRLAVGASRARLVGQALVESVVLALLGGGAGLVVAFAGTRAILRLAFSGTQSLPISAAPSLPVLLFALAASLLTGILFGVAPAWLATRTNPVEALRGAGRSTGSAAALPQKSLVVFQAAASLVLLTAAALLTASLNHLQTANYGFDPQGRVSVRIDFDQALTQPVQIDNFYRAVTDKLRAIPGVSAVSYAKYTPMSGSNWSTSTYAEGQPPSPNLLDNTADYNRVGPDYFSLVGTRILRGRTLTEDDVANARPVAVVSQAFARRYFPGKDPLGRHFGANELSHAGEYEIVGVAEDARYSGGALRDPPRPMWFVPLSYWEHYSKPRQGEGTVAEQVAAVLLLQTNAPISSLGPQIRRALAEVDSNVAVVSIDPLRRVMLNQFTQQALVARLAGLFGLLALILASVGLYGVTAYTVEQRTAEIGIRMALGADRLSVVRMVLRSAFTQVLIGLAIGIPATLVATHFIASQLYGTGRSNLDLLLAATGTLALAALVSALLPARRAANTDPVIALRTQ